MAIPRRIERQPYRSYAGFVAGGLRWQVLASISGAEDGAINPAAWVERHARRRPGDPALAEGDRVCASWGEFAARTAGAATGLRDQFGLSPGDRAAIVMRNRPEYLEALFAIWHAGLVAVPVNARLHRDEIAYILEHSESAVTVTDADHAGDVESLAGTVASLKAAVVAPGERWDRLTGSSRVEYTPARADGPQPEQVHPIWLLGNATRGWPCRQGHPRVRDTPGRQGYGERRTQPCAARPGPETASL